MSSSGSSGPVVCDMRARSFVLVVSCLIVVCGAARSAATQERALVFPLRVHVAPGASESEAPAVSDEWLREQVATANQLFGPHGVGFRVEEQYRLPERHAMLETRSDRHALGALVDSSRIDVFIVRSLRDVDDPSLMRRGVHWRPAGYPGAHFVIVSAIASPTVLAHELGHYFGNPHSMTPGNIMSYERGDGPPFFDAAQGVRIRRFARNFARRRAPAPTERDARDELPVGSGIGS